LRIVRWSAFSEVPITALPSAPGRCGPPRKAGGSGGTCGAEAGWSWQHRFPQLVAQRSVLTAKLRNDRARRRVRITVHERRRCIAEHLAAPAVRYALNEREQDRHLVPHVALVKRLRLACDL